MIGDQLTYLETAFYNSNCSKPNGSASPFGEAQFDDTKPRSAVSKLCSDGTRLLLLQKRPAMLSFGQGDSDALRDSFEQGTPAPSNANGFVLLDEGQSTERPPRSERIISMPPAP